MATLRARLFRHVYLAWPGLAGLGLAARSAGLLALDWVRAGGSPTRSGLVGGRTCARCGIEARVPGVSLAADGRCVECRASAPPAGVALPGGRGAITLARISEPEVRAALTPRGDGRIDALVALSGGKDSLVTLTSAVALGLRLEALTLDNGFLLAPALDACRSWCERLAVPLIVVRAPLHESVRGALERKRLLPWPCVECFDHLTRALLETARRLAAPTILTGLRYRWTGDRSLAAASEAFAAYAPPAFAAGISVVNLPAALALGEAEERELLAQHGWTDPGLAGHSTNCLLPAHFEHLHRERTGHPHDSVRFVALEARLGVISREVAIERMRGAAPDPAHAAELARRLAAGSGP